jgi:hypothetical protein
MSRHILTLLMLIAGPCVAGPLTDEQILDAVRLRATALEEVTTKPVLMHARTRLLCRPPTRGEFAEEEGNPHLEKYARLYVDKAGRSAAEGHEPVHQEGTLLIKEKLPMALPADDAASIKVQPGKSPELFTGMLKREKGYNPACGDWEFFTLSGDARQMTARGKLTSCMECHQRYPDRDFTSRKLVPERRVQPKADGSIVLTARDAMVSGSGLRWDRAADILTAWTGSSDAAAWHLNIPGGRYNIEIVHANSVEDAGAKVALQFSYPGGVRPFQTLSLEPEDTGGAGNFKSQNAGAFEASEDAVLVLKVTSQSKTGTVVMDLKQVLIRPVR